MIFLFLFSECHEEHQGLAPCMVLLPGMCVPVFSAQYRHLRPLHPLMLLMKILVDGFC